MIKEAYVSYEVARLLKEKGFPQEYDIYHSMVYNEEDYENEYEVQRMVLETHLIKAGTLSSYPVGVPEPKCFCPTHQTAMAWLRQTYKINIVIMPAVADKDGDGGCLYKYIIFKHAEVVYKSECLYEKYDVACDDALKYVLENLI